MIALNNSSPQTANLFGTILLVLGGGGLAIWAGVTAYDRLRPRNNAIQGGGRTRRVHRHSTRESRKRRA